MTTPNIDLPELIAAQAQPHVPINTALRHLDALTCLVVIGSLNAPPGSPADGDRYIVGPSPTGAWAGQALRIAYYSGTAWQFIAPQEGWVAYRQSTAELVKYAEVGSPDEWAPLRVDSAVHDVSMYFPGVPGNLQRMLQHSATRAMTFPSNFAGSRGHASSLPTATTVLSVKVAGSVVGTVSISTLGVFTFATTGSSAHAVSVGDKIEILNQASADLTAGDISVTLVAEL